MDFQLQPISSKLRHFTLYESDDKFFLVGSDNAKMNYRFLKIEKQTSKDLEIIQDVGEYSAVQMSQLLQMISSSQRNGLRTRIKKAYGVLGFIRFTQSYHMILVTERQRMGNVGSGNVYEIRSTQMINLAREEPKKKPNILTKDVEQRYKEAFQSLDLSHDFYYSYLYDLSRPLQQNMSQQKDENSEMFVWNSFLMEPLLQRKISPCWMLPIIHGYYGQTRLSVVGRAVDVVLIGRRSRYFAGTRYLKRGINDTGHVANFVETEQIVFDINSLYQGQSKGLFSSYVQSRGSIPLYWSQTIVTKMVNPKPDIELGKFDPGHESAKQHFEQLQTRYGKTIVVLDLVKRKEKKPREGILGQAYQECVNYLNQHGFGIGYEAWDFRRAIKDKPERALNELAAFAEENLRKTDFFHVGNGTNSAVQRGVIRTNCIDCLDRTNIVQFFIGKYALGQQLYALGILDTPHLVYHSNVVRALMELYDSLGDKIALQYGGSRTVSAGINHRGFSWDVMTSLRRYYSNNFKDENKQHAINLFLGNYRPSAQLFSLWDMDGDQTLADISKIELDDTSEPPNGEIFSETYDRFEVVDLEPYLLSTVLVHHSEPDDRADTHEETQHTVSPDRIVSPILFPRVQSPVQSQVLRKFEDKMNRDQISILDHVCTPKPTFLKDLFHTDRDTERKYKQDCEKYYTQYTNEFAAGYAQFISNTSMDNEPVYEQYLSGFAQPTKESDDVIYQDYVKKRTFDEPMQEPVTEPVVAVLPVSDIVTRLQAFYPKMEIDQIYNNLVQLTTRMRNDLCIMDRVRHPRPAKKLFNQTSLFELLKGRLYRKCFLSCKAIDWLLEHQLFEHRITTRERAQEFMQLLLECHFIRHVSFAKLFLDGHYLYKFAQDDSVRILNTLTEHPSAMEPLQLSVVLLQEITMVYRSVLEHEGIDVDPVPIERFLTALKTSKVKTYRHFNEWLVSLAGCDLTKLASNQLVRMAFFVNIYHCLLLHGLMISCKSAQNRLQGKAMHGFYTRTCYVIGGYRFSLSDIRDGILRGNHSFPGSLEPTFEKGDPRATMCVNDLRLLFLLQESDTIWRSKDEISIKLQTQRVKYDGPENPLFVAVTEQTLEQAMNQYTGVYLQDYVTISYNTITLTKYPFGLPEFGKSVRELLSNLILLCTYANNNFGRNMKENLEHLVEELEQQKRPVFVQYSSQ